MFEIFYQFYSGYRHFSEKGYIHRDIKPSNILIRKKKDRLKAKSSERYSFFNDKPCDTDSNEYVIADFGFIKYH